MTALTTELWAELALDWRALLDRLGLPELPAFLPLPRDQRIRLRVLVGTDGCTLETETAIVLDADPDLFGLRIGRTIRLALSFRAPGVAELGEALEGGGVFGVTLTADLRIKLPELPGLGPLPMRLSDQEGWIPVSLAIEADSETGLRLTGSVPDGACTVDVMDLVRAAAARLGPAAAGGVDGIPLDASFALSAIELRLGPAGIGFALTMRVAIGGVSGFMALRLSNEGFALGLSYLRLPVGLPALALTTTAFDGFLARRKEGLPWDGALMAEIGRLDAEIAASHGEQRRAAQAQRATLLQRRLLMAGVLALVERGAKESSLLPKVRQILVALDGVQSRLQGPSSDRRYRLTPTRLDDLERLLGLPASIRGKLDAIAGEGAEGQLLAPFVATVKGRLSATEWALHGEAIVERARVVGTPLAIEVDGRKTVLSDGLSVVLRDVGIEVPFAQISEIAVSGTLMLEDLVGPLAMLSRLRLKLGIASDLIFFALEGADATVPLSFNGDDSGYVSFSEFRLGISYARRSLAVAFAGAMRLPTTLVDLLDTSDVAAAGIRMPVESRIAFRLDFIPMPSPSVAIVIPVFQFKLDLRQGDVPAVAPGARCAPSWDGLQLNVPGLLRVGLKQFAFAPMFGFLPAPNVLFDGDLVLGSATNGVMLVVDDYLSIGPVGGTSVPIPIPGLADSSGFVEHLCLSIRIAGFALEGELQRPFPSVSPFAALEALAWLSSPETYALDPQGDLARMLRVTLRDLRLVLPEPLNRLFPTAAGIVRHPQDFEVNLGTLLDATQDVLKVVGPVAREMLAAAESLAADPRAVQRAIAELPRRVAALEPGDVLMLLPPSVRRTAVAMRIGSFEGMASLVLGPPELFGAKPPKRPPAKRGKAITALRGYAAPLRDKRGRLDRVDRASSPFDDPAFEGFTPADLAAAPKHPLAGRKGASPAVVVAARLRVVGSQALRFIGRLHEDGRFALVTRVGGRLKLEVAGIRVPLPLQAAADARFELVGRVLPARVQATVTARGSASWSLANGRGVIAITDAVLQLGSDGRFKLGGKAGVALLGLQLVGGKLDITQSRAAIEDLRVDYALTVPGRGKVLGIKGRVDARATAGPLVEADGKVALTLFDRRVSAAAFNARADRRGVAMRVAVVVKNAGVKIGAVPIEVDVRGSAALSVPTKGIGTALIDGRWRVGCLGAELRGQGALALGAKGIKLNASGELRWPTNGPLWTAASIALDEEAGVIELGGRTSIVLPLSPANLSGTPFARLLVNLDLAGTFRIETKTGTVSFRLRGGWLLGIRTDRGSGREQFFPVAARRLTMDAHAESLALMTIGGFRLLPELGLSIPVPSVSLDPDRYIRMGVLRSAGPLNTEIYEAYIEAHAPSLGTPKLKGPTLLSAEGEVTIPAVTIGTGTDVSLALGAADLAFSMSLIWHDGALAVQIARTGHDPFIIKLW